MGLPGQPVTLSVEQVDELNRKLADLRHDINNQLSLIIAAGELIRFKPQTTERLAVTLTEQPKSIMAKLHEFSTDFERILRITRS